MTTQEYRDHLHALVREHKIQVCELIGGGNSHAEMQGMSCPSLRKVVFPEVKNGQTYAVALHEIGHIVDPRGHNISKGMASDLLDPMMVYDLLTEEHAAWEWAQRMAIEWTDEMTAMRDYAVGTYTKQLKLARGMVAA